MKKGIANINLASFLMYGLGLTSTMQILSLFGFSLSTWFTAAIVAYFLILAVINRKLSLHIEPQWWIYVVILLLATANALLGNFLPKAYISSAMLALAQLLLLLAAFLLSTGAPDKSQNIHWFMKGFDLSCKIQLFWCLLQLVMDTLFSIDLNQIVFNHLLKMTELTSQQRNEGLACSGLHWHAANMLPVLVYLYFVAKPKWLKLLCVYIAYETHSATILIAIILCLGIDILVYGKDYLHKIKSTHLLRKKATCILLSVASIGILCIVAPIAVKSISYLIQRIAEVNNPTVGNSSSAIHMSYLTSFGSIWSTSNITEILFGYGLNTSGAMMTHLYGMYPDIVWVVESDFANILINQGIIGFLFWYGILGYTMLCAWKSPKYRPWACVLAVLIMCGLTYNNQFLWVILFELMIFEQVKKNEPTMIVTIKKKISNLRLKLNKRGDNDES